MTLFLGLVVLGHWQDQGIAATQTEQNRFIAAQNIEMFLANAPSAKLMGRASTNPTNANECFIRPQATWNQLSHDQQLLITSQWASTWFAISRQHPAYAGNESITLFAPKGQIIHLEYQGG